MRFVSNKKAFCASKALTSQNENVKEMGVPCQDYEDKVLCEFDDLV